MRFKIVGVLLLLVGLYFASRGWWLADQARIITESAKVDVLIAIFLASTVRVLQAEKHYREQVRREYGPRPRPPHPEFVDEDE